MRILTWVLAGAAVAGGQLAAQAAVPDSGPSPAQQRFTDGLRTAARGVAQLKDGIGRVGRARVDTAQLRMAGQRLGGLCGSAGTFVRQGRAKMTHTAYTDSARIAARRLNQQVDSLLAFLPQCQREGGKAPTATAATLVSRLRTYEAALQKFREMLAQTVAPTPAPTPPTQ